MLPDLECLRCFDAAASQLNFRAAARLVALSPAAFSGRIRRLEEDLGAALFLRTTRKVTLSPEGERLWPQVKRALNEVALCAQVMKSTDARLPFVLQVGTRFELGLSWITPALDALSRSRPERTLHLYFADSADLLQRVKDGRLDCAITSARLTSAWAKYAVLHEETYELVASPKLAKSKPLAAPQTARNHTLIDLHGDLPLFRYFLDACPPGQVWAFAKKELLGTIAAVRHRVLEGAGVAVLPSYFIKDDLKRGRLVRLLPRVRLLKDFFRLIWREGHAREPELDILANELRSRPLQ